MTLLLVPVRCFFCLPLLPRCQHSIELQCGRSCAARRGDCASFCVACSQHWTPNRKISISMGLFLYMDVLCPLRLNSCLKLVVFTMCTALLVLVADVGPPYFPMVLLVCLLDFLRHTYTQRCE
ncbi:hypothetical protein TcCL_ESM02111 [Trypanosoma cruzi]|nr:hypothetical protein TcCL_ESM02111 [Trypanosoma cruzi]